MIKKTVFALLFLLSLQQTVLIASLPQNTITVPTQTVVLEPYHNINNLNYLGSSVGAQWIWKTGGQSWPDGDTLTFEANFYSDCANTAELRITADNIFSASVNGGAALTGNDWTKVYTFKVANLICGSNKLSVKVTNKDQNSAAALIFAVVQDQSGCYKCQSPTSFYNIKTCKCECIGGCDCGTLNRPWQWIDYPTCGCICKSITQCNSKSYWNKKTCKCECKPKSCLPGQIQNRYTCECTKICPIIQICINGKVWDSIKCKCVCDKIQVCSSPLYWDESNCKCSRFCPLQACPRGLTWNTSSCECYCNTATILVGCQSPSVWSYGICGCCLPKNCGIIAKFDINTCQCISYIPTIAASNRAVALDQVVISTLGDSVDSGTTSLDGITELADYVDSVAITCVIKICGLFEVWNDRNCDCQSSVKAPI